MSEPRTIQLAFPGQILPSDSLEAYYSFDDGTATDQSGNGRNGTVEGATYTRAGESRGCLSFDGVDDYVSFPRITLSRTGSAISFRVNVRDFTDPVDGVDGVTLFRDSSLAYHKFIALFADRVEIETNTNQPRYRFYRTFNEDDTYHIVITLSDDEASVYVNGGIVGSPQTLNDDIDIDRIGLSSNSSGYQKWFDGWMDEVRIYSRALSAAEVDQIYRYTGFVDVSHLVLEGSQEEYTRMVNEERRSVVDSYTFQLRHDRDITDGFSNATEKIWCTVDEAGGEHVFTGWIAPTDEWTIHQVVGPRSVEALDMSYLLDEPIAQSVQYPELVTDPGYAILDSSNPSESIVHLLLDMAGYDPSTDIDPSCPQITATVQSVAAEKGSETYREILDDLLSEYGYTLFFTESGLFSVYQWDRDTVTPSATISFVGVSHGLRISKRETEHDGVETTWAELDVMEDALVYRHNLPISTEPGGWEFSGEPIAAGDYYPADSDIEDIFQRFREKWLDTPYLRRETRRQNKDLSLVNTSGHRVEFTADDDVVIVTEEYEPTRSRVSFQNAGGDTQRIYTWDIFADALYRSTIRETTVPSTATNPERYTSRFIFDEDRATRYCTARSRLLRFGAVRYSFEDRVDYQAGDIVTLRQEREGLTTIETTVVILERSKNPQRPLRRYRAQGITAFSAEAALKVGIGTPNEAARRALDDAVRITTPSFDDIDNGYTSASGGTTTPTQPTVLAESAEFGVGLFVDRQTNLTNFRRYEWQVSPDGGTTVFALSWDGTGLGAEDPGDNTVYTERETEFFTHAPLPLDTETNGVDDPLPKSWWYRCRRDTKKNDKSAWSAWVTAQSLPQGAGRLAADSVFANNIHATAFQAMFAKIAYQLMIGFRGSGTYDEPEEGDVGWYIDEDELKLLVGNSGNLWEEIFHVKKRSNARLADLMVTGSLKAGEAVLSLPGMHWRVCDSLISDLGAEETAAGDVERVRKQGVSVSFGWIYAARGASVYTSNDGARTWSHRSEFWESGEGITNQICVGPSVPPAYNRVLMSVGEHVKVSEDSGFTWSTETYEPFGTTIWSRVLGFHYAWGTWMAYGRDGKYSLAGITGTDWPAEYYTTPNTYDIVGAMTPAQDVWVLVSTAYIYRSTDNAQSFSHVYHEGTYTPIACKLANQMMVAVCLEGAILISDDYGLTWSYATVNLPSATSLEVTSVDFGDGLWLAAGKCDGKPMILRSTDNARHWDYRTTVGEAEPFFLGVPGNDSYYGSLIVYDRLAEAWALLGATVNGTVHSGLQMYATMLPAGSGIVDQGENENGHYVVFSSGLQVCWLTKTGLDNDDDATWVFPQAFAEDSAHPFVVSARTGGYAGISAEIRDEGGTMSTSVLFRLWREAGAFPSGSGKAILFAVGESG